MAINIKNDRVHELAREAARLTGLTQTGAIQQALERLVRDLGTDPDAVAVRSRLDLAQSIALAYSADPGDGEREITTVTDLYDDSGLPR